MSNRVCLFSWSVCAAVLSLWACTVHGTDSPGPTNTGCCNVVELRQYTLRPGRREPFIALFDSTFADPLDATGMTVIGQFRDLDRPNRFVWMRGFQDMPSRAKELAAFYDSVLWHMRRDEANASIDDSDNVLLLEPASPKIRLEDIPPRPAASDTTARVGFLVIALFYMTSDDLSAFATLFDHSLRPRAEAAGARIVGEYVTSNRANNFPRLPIRVAEHIFVSVSEFADAAAYTDYQVKLAADKEWTKTLWPQARAKLTREPEILRLTPTQRSRLRG